VLGGENGGAGGSFTEKGDANVNFLLKLQFEGRLTGVENSSLFLCMMHRTERGGLCKWQKAEFAAFPVLG
jgi:hypothetical protein